MGEEAPISVFGLINVLLRHYRLVVLVPLVAAIVAAGAEWMKSSTLYSATSSFLLQGETQSASMPSWIGGLLNQPQRTGSFEFFEALAGSREVVREIAREHYVTATEIGGRDTLRGTLAQIYKVQDASSVVASGISLEAGRGGIVSLATTARYPDLAVGINAQVLETLNSYNIRHGQARASNEAVFIESRMAEARQNLEIAENDLQRFLEQNRNYEASPQLNVARARLQRRVDLRQELYLSLARSYDNMRIETMRRAPAFTIIEPAELGGQVSTGRPLRAGMIALLGALVLTIVLAYLLEFLKRQPGQDPDAYREFRELSRSTLEGIRPRLRTRGERPGRLRGNDD